MNIPHEGKEGEAEWNIVPSPGMQCLFTDTLSPQHYILRSSYVIQLVKIKTRLSKALTNGQQKNLTPIPL